MPDTTGRLDPLHWGEGAIVFEMFLEPTCPFSYRAFRKIDALLDLVGRDRLTVKVRLHSQPWHMYSPVITRAILAASTLPEGREAARAVLDAVGRDRDDFEFTDHATGPNRDATPNDIIARIEERSGLTLAVAFDAANLDAELRWQTKYSRQNGIHVSPTFMIDGLVAADLSSGDPAEKWAERILS